MNGGWVQTVQQFNRFGLPLHCTGPFMLMIDNPDHIDPQTGLHLPLGGGAAWPRERLLVRDNLGLRALVGLEQSWAEFDVVIPAGRRLYYRWCFYNCDPHHVGTDFALLQVRHRGTGQLWNQVLSIGAFMPGPRTGGPTGWQVTAWPSKPATTALPLRLRFLCCSGGVAELTQPGTTDRINGWSWPQDWLAYPSVLLLDGFDVR